MSIKRKARKNHKCILCKKTINKGEEYLYQRITPWDHPINERFFSYKAHEKCDEAWLKVGDQWDWEFPDSGKEFLELTESIK